MSKFEKQKHEQLIRHTIQMFIDENTFLPQIKFWNLTRVQGQARKMMWHVFYAHCNWHVRDILRFWCENGTFTNETRLSSSQMSHKMPETLVLSPSWFPPNDVFKCCCTVWLGATGWFRHKQQNVVNWWTTRTNMYPGTNKLLKHKLNQSNAPVLSSPQ